MLRYYFAITRSIAVVAICVASGLIATTSALAGADSRPATTQATTRPVDSWRHDEMRLAAYDVENANGGRIPKGELRVVRWRVIEDERPLVVEQAIVLVKADDGRWRLAQVYRHPKATRPPV